jgi:hypothetical protein
MPKKSAKNNELLKSIKNKTSPQIYDLVLHLVNDDREDMAETALKIDYLIDYAGTCIRQKDYKEAEDTMKKASVRIDKLRSEGADTEYFEYLLEGIKRKLK